MISRRCFARRDWWRARASHCGSSPLPVGLSMVLTGLALIVPGWASAAPDITAVNAPGSGQLYSKYEVTFQLSTTPANPYDPTQYEVYGVFSSPSGTTGSRSPL